MPLELISRPPLPGMPRKKQDIIMNNEVGHSVRMHRITPEVRESLEVHLMVIKQVLSNFSYFAITGSFRITITRDSIDIDGSLTNYYVPDQQWRDKLLDALNLAVNRLKYKFQPWIQRIEFSLIQSMILPKSD